MHNVLCKCFIYASLEPMQPFLSSLNTQTSNHGDGTAFLKGRFFISEGHDRIKTRVHHINNAYGSSPKIAQDHF